MAPLMNDTFTCHRPGLLEYTMMIKRAFGVGSSSMYPEARMTVLLAGGDISIVFLAGKKC